MGLEIDREFEFYLVAHEFKVPVEEVKKWPLTKFMKHNKYLAEYYKLMGGGGQGIKLPPGMSGMGMPSADAKNQSGRPLHTFHFKEIDNDS